MFYTVRPISDRTAFSGRHKSSPFRAGWSSTQDILGREFRALAARQIVFELDVTDADIRNDGLLRASARPSTPAIRMAFESRHGPLVYATDGFSTWQDNARAIALTLQALRRVDDYGVVKRGEQYTGFKALPAGRAMPASHMTSEEAYDVLYSYLTEDELGESFTERDLWRKARAVAHPDRNGGDRARWDEVEQAATVLGVAS